MRSILDNLLNIFILEAAIGFMTGLEIKDSSVSSYKGTAASEYISSVEPAHKKSLHRFGNIKTLAVHLLRIQYKSIGNSCCNRMIGFNIPDTFSGSVTPFQITGSSHQLLKDLRKELYEIFGDGEYIHIGCDEAYYITRNDELRQDLAGYLKRLTTEIEQEGRRPMMWMDMLLEAGQFPDCYTVGHPEEAEALRNSTAASTVFVDWQYDCFQVPIPSLSSLKNSGHDVLGAPWYNPRNYQAHIDTVLQEDLQGIMLTTWHTLKQYMPSILDCAKKCGASTFTWSPYSSSHEETATLLRRLSFEGNAYEDCGWSKTQIEM